MGSNDRAYIYGRFNGESHVVAVEAGDHDMSTAPTPATIRTHWDPRVEVSTPGGVGVQIGVVPPRDGDTSDADAVYDPENGQFMTLDRDGINRFIQALREARVRVYGKDE